jgi:hypothetical protein
MKFQPGDKVILLHSNEEGEVVDIINDKMVMVDVRGVKFPAYIDQLDFPYFRNFSEKQLFSQKKEKKYIDDINKEKKAPKKIADGVWLSLLPVFETDEFGDELVDELKIHLVNRTETAYIFQYKLLFFGKPEFDLKGEVKPFEDFYIHDVAFSEMSDSPSFHFEFSLVEHQKGKSEYFESNVKLKPKQLFDRIEELKLRGEATFSYKLFEVYPNTTIEEGLHFDSLLAKGVKIYNLKEARKHLPPARTIVDLHIEKLMDDWKGLTNAEILNIQLKEFDKWYDLAVAHHQSQFIVIHGVGMGRLRDEIHDALRLKKEVKTFVNQFHPSFGFGATEIFFQY